MVSTRTSAGHLHRWLLSGAVLFASLSGSCAPAGARIPEKIDKFVLDCMDRYKVPGVAIAVIDHDDSLVGGFGTRTYGKSAPVDADTLFMIASNTKPFTAALLGTLVDQKLIGWDDHVVDRLPEFALKDPYPTRMCTPRDLLAHRSGLPPFGGNNLEALGFSRAEILRRMKFIEPHCSFRDKAGYSNPGFFAAGMLAARVANTGYEDLMRKSIFGPLKMTGSGLSHHDREGRDNVADAHKLLSDGSSAVVPWDDHDPMAPAGAITSTSRDMANWVRMWLDNGRFDGEQLLSPETVEEMLTPSMVETPTFAEMAPIDRDSGFSYGLGWGIYYYKGHKIIEKGGARTGMRSIVVLVPDKKIGIVVLANQNLTVVPEAIRAYLLEEMVAPSGRDLQKEISEANDHVVKTFTRREAPATPSAPTSVPVSNYAGKYGNDLYGVVEILVDDQNRLWWQAGPAKVKGPLAPLGHDVFLLSWPGERISLPEEATFVLSSEGKPVTLITESFGELKRME